MVQTHTNNIKKRYKKTASQDYKSQRCDIFEVGIFIDKDLATEIKREWQ